MGCIIGMEEVGGDGNCQMALEEREVADCCIKHAWKGDIHHCLNQEEGTREVAFFYQRFVTNGPRYDTL